MRKTLFGLSILLVAAAPLRAQSAHPPLHVDPTLDDCSVRFAPELTQGAFRRFAREFGSVSAFKQVASPEILDRGRVLIGIELISFEVDQWSDAWHDTFYHPDADHPLGATQSFAKVKVRAGVTDDVEVGAFYTRNPQANYGWLGLDGRYALLTEGVDGPYALGVRGAWTKTLHVSDMNMDAATADISVGRRLRGVAMPYAGLGADAVFARETSDAVDLRSETVVAPHVFGGVELVLWRRLRVAAELTLGARTSTQVQVGGVAF